MSDAELLTDCILAIERGVISTSANDLRSLYRMYDEHFPEAGSYRAGLRETFDFFGAEFGALRGTHMMKPYALHSLVTAMVHLRFGIPAIEMQFGVPTLGQFVNNVDNLLALAQAHEAKEVDGPHAKYVWGCLAGTNRAPRRAARVAAILRALGSNVPDHVDANLA